MTTVTDIKQLAANAFGDATCTLAEYLAVNPDDDANDYANAIIHMVGTRLIGHSRDLLRREIIRLAQDN